MSFKTDFLNSHLDYFPENLRDVSEVQGERFHRQDIKEMECWYQGRWNVNMGARYYWTLKRDESHMVHKRERHTRTFEEKKTGYHKNL
jgi:hypothetical protein